MNFNKYAFVHICLCKILFYKHVAAEHLCFGPAGDMINESLICLPEKRHHCLEVFHLQVYQYICTIPKQIEIGHFAVLDPKTKYIDAIKCPGDRYQPFPFFSFEMNKCVYVKSSCSEEGQIRQSNGSATEDIRCICDDSRGYQFVTKPRGKSCFPSKEDCSCVRKSPIGMEELSFESKKKSKTPYSSGWYNQHDQPPQLILELKDKKLLALVALALVFAIASSIVLILWSCDCIEIEWFRCTVADIKLELETTHGLTRVAKNDIRQNQTSIIKYIPNQVMIFETNFMSRKF